MFRITVLLCVALYCVYVVPSLAKPRQDEDKERVHSGKLSEHEHFTATGEHNSEYDHDAFLGSEKKEFDNLTPEESKRRLGLIVDRIDKDKDGKISREEMKDWIRFSGKRWIYDDNERLWAHFKERQTFALRHGGKDVDIHAKADPNAPIPWELWKEGTFGKQISENEEEQFRRDRKRWEYADVNNDDKISKEEFTALIHPHEFDHMKELVVMESIYDMDVDKDGYISLNEYIDDIFKQRNLKTKKEKDETMKEERALFHSTRDKDKDGRLNKKEVREYIFPDYDDAGAEADHLIFNSDLDKDGKLSIKEEVMATFDIFVGSSATEFGKAFKRHAEF